MIRFLFFMLICLGTAAHAQVNSQNTKLVHAESKELFVNGTIVMANIYRLTVSGTRDVFLNEKGYFTQQKAPGRAPVRFVVFSSGVEPAKDLQINSVTANFPNGAIIRARVIPRLEPEIFEPLTEFKPNTEGDAVKSLSALFFCKKSEEAEEWRRQCYSSAKDFFETLYKEALMALCDVSAVLRVNCYRENNTFFDASIVTFYPELVEKGLTYKIVEQGCEAFAMSPEDFKALPVVTATEAEKFCVILERDLTKTHYCVPNFGGRTVAVAPPNLGKLTAYVPDWSAYEKTNRCTPPAYNIVFKPTNVADSIASAVKAKLTAQEERLKRWILENPAASKEQFKASFSDSLPGITLGGFSFRADAGKVRTIDVNFVKNYVALDALSISLEDQTGSDLFCGGAEIFIPRESFVDTGSDIHKAEFKLERTSSSSAEFSIRRERGDTSSVLLDLAQARQLAAIIPSHGGENCPGLLEDITISFSGLNVEKPTSWKLFGEGTLQRSGVAFYLVAGEQWSPGSSISLEKHIRVEQSLLNVVSEAIDHRAGSAAVQPDYVTASWVFNDNGLNFEEGFLETGKSALEPLKTMSWVDMWPSENLVDGEIPAARDLNWSTFKALGSSLERHFNNLGLSSSSPIAIIGLDYPAGGAVDFCSDRLSDAPDRAMIVAVENTQGKVASQISSDIGAGTLLPLFESSYLGQCPDKPRFVLSTAGLDPRLVASTNENLCRGIANFGIRNVLHAVQPCLAQK